MTTQTLGSHSWAAMTLRDVDVLADADAQLPPVVIPKTDGLPTEQIICKDCGGNLEMDGHTMCTGDPDD